MVDLVSDCYVHNDRNKMPFKLAMSAVLTNLFFIILAKGEKVKLLCASISVVTMQLKSSQAQIEHFLPDHAWNK